MYSGSCGPGTLEITRLCTGRLLVRLVRAYALIAMPNTAGAANCDQSCRSVAAIAELCSLATEFASAMDSSRSAESGIWLSNRENIPETWLRPGRSDRPCADTGTIATNDESGSSPRSSKNCRNTPDTSAITTSLTLTSKWLLTVLGIGPGDPFDDP